MIIQIHISRTLTIIYNHYVLRRMQFMAIESTVILKFKDKSIVGVVCNNSG